MIAFTYSKPLLWKFRWHVPSPPGKGEKVADRPDEGVFIMALSKKSPSPCPLPRIVCGESAVEFEIAFPQTNRGRGDLPMVFVP